MRCECEGYGWCHKKHEFPDTIVSRHPNRTFDPTWNELYKGDISDILGTCSGCKEYALRVRGQDTEVDCGAAAVFTDGACRNNGNSGARASVAVFYGPDSKRNSSATLGPMLSHTSQNAEIFAASTAVEDVIKMDPEGKRRLCRLLIITDSKYVVDGISKWVWIWKCNGWVDSNGRPVINKRGFEILDGLLGQLEARGTDVWFWHVPRWLNKELMRWRNDSLIDTTKILSCQRI